MRDVMDTVVDLFDGIENVHCDEAPSCEDCWDPDCPDSMGYEPDEDDEDDDSDDDWDYGDGDGDWDWED